jgi:hypothetical protein
MSGIALAQTMNTVAVPQVFDDIAGIASAVVARFDAPDDRLGRRARPARISSWGLVPERGAGRSVAAACDPLEIGPHNWTKWMLTHFSLRRSLARATGAPN